MSRKIHHCIPFLSRLYTQRNVAREERDIALAERGQALRELGNAQQLTQQAVHDSDEAQRHLNEVRIDRNEKGSSSHKLYVPLGHYFSPIVNVAEAEQYFKHLNIKDIENIPGIDVNKNDMIAVWNELLPFLTTNPFPDQPGMGFRYAFENGSYSWGDGSILHAMIRKHRPKRYIEIGSGWSSVCAVDTIERYSTVCQITFIEPYPDLLNGLLGKTKLSVDVAETSVQKVPVSLFDTLEQNDILFIDSTHVLRTGSDVCFELFEIMPRLKPGVLVHFHDIFWPFEYPAAWVIDDNRSWNELYAVRAFLTNNGQWEILFFNNYFAQMEKELIENTYPTFLKNSGGALWLRRR